MFRVRFLRSGLAPMSERLYSRCKVLARNMLALLVGIAVAVALVSMHQFVELTLARGLSHDEEKYLFKTRDLVEAAAIASAFVAALLVLFCVPIWLLLARFGLAGWHSAAALGFAAPVIYWTL